MRICHERVEQLKRFLSLEWQESIFPVWLAVAQRFKAGNALITRRGVDLAKPTTLTAGTRC